MLGATVGCCCCNCSSNYHYMCARRKNCVFLHNKEVYCHKHSSLGSKGESVKEEEMKVNRCILIYTDLEKPGKKMTRTINPTQLSISIGTCMFYVHVYMYMYACITVVWQISYEIFVNKILCSFCFHKYGMSSIVTRNVKSFSYF